MDFPRSRSFYVKCRNFQAIFLVVYLNRYALRSYLRSWIQTNYRIIGNLLQSENQASLAQRNVRVKERCRVKEIKLIL